jgi:hypothetical protein
MRRAALAALAAAFSTFLILHAGALDKSTGPPPPDIVVLVDPLQESAVPFGHVIADAAHYRLESLGLDAQIDLVSPSEDASPRPRAEATGASAVLVCSYRVDGRQMAVTLGWYDSQTGAATASAEGRGDVDLHLDGVILAALDDILAKVGSQLQALQARKTAQAAAASAPPVKPVSVAAPPPVLPAQEAPVAAAVEPTKAPAGIRLLLAGGFAPFVPVGAASSYFALGYLPSLLASFLLPTRAGPVGIGVYTGMDYFAAVGLIDTSNNYLIPIGIDVRYELDAGSLRPFIHVTAGPALLVMVTGTQGTRLDVMPFLKSGIGLEYRITSWLGIVAAADYDIYFEMPYLIMGFTPSVNMAVRL